MFFLESAPFAAKIVDYGEGECMKIPQSSGVRGQLKVGGWKS